LLDLKELQKPSKGEKLIQKIKESDLLKGEAKKEIKKVDVVKGEAIEKKNTKRTDKYGLPIPDNRKNWDSV